jgi:hypothetical protein
MRAGASTIRARGERLRRRPHAVVIDASDWSGLNAAGQLSHAFPTVEVAVGLGLVRQERAVVVDVL